jgi:uncharacterized protein YqeY
MLQKELKLQLKKAIKSGDFERKKAIRMVLGEIPRLNKKKGEQVIDEDIFKIITKLIKSEITILGYANIDESSSKYLQILKKYLPTMMSEKEIEAWVLDNIDFSAYIIPMKAMGPIMKELKGKADGNLVKQVLTRSN